MAGPKITILVVDDSATNRAYLIEILKNAHFNVLESSSGLEAIAIAKEKHPQIIITDILMPIMDGYEMVIKLKGDPILAKIKVIFNTAEYPKEEGLKLAKMFGIIHYLNKPTEKNEVLQAVNDVLHEKITSKKLSKLDLEKISQKHVDLLNAKLFEQVTKLGKMNNELEARISERTGELQVLNKKLQEESTRDPLTGLFNRRYLEDILVREISRATRHKKTFSVVMIDIDHFKLVNDKYGHRVGDVVLYTLAQKLISVARVEDVVCRYGGEEFIIILFDIAPKETLERMEIIRKKVEELQIKAQDNVISNTTISMGVSFYPFNSDNINSLIEMADQALYQAKESGRNRIVVAKSDDEKKLQEKLNPTKNNFIKFSLGNQLFALSINFVRRIVHSVEITNLKSASKNRLGIINFQGEIIPVVDIRNCLGLPKAEIELEDFLIITEFQYHVFAFSAKETSFIEVENVMIKVNPAEENELIESFIQDPEDLIHILNLEKVLGLQAGNGIN